MVFLLRPLILLLTIFALPAQAASPLLFRKNITDIRIRSVAGFLIEKGHLDGRAPYQVASVDLNNDGVNEFLFFQPTTGCEARADCSYLVAGLSSAKAPVLIAAIKARKIGIADEKVYGVHSLFVYNQQSNDFAYETFVWSPRLAGYGP